MKRAFKDILLEWKSHPLRMPLIVRGARQVGKTYIIQSFGNEEFVNTVTINFELQPLFQNCFETLDPQQIIQQIELLSHQKITSGKTLLFFDEIQQCPRALQSLRYFKEELPDLHVITAGSLLEFAIHDENFSFPVGRVQFAKLYPLSFEEYLDAVGDGQISKQLALYDFNNPPPNAIHEHLLNRLREYFIIGGMPAAVSAYLKTKSFLEVKYVQKSLWEAFEADFGKYAKKTQHKFLKKIFDEAPKLLGEHVKYSRIDPDLPNPAREIKRAIELLGYAGILHTLHASPGGALPLSANFKESIFKLLFLDIGLVENMMEVDPFHPGLMTGPLAEQFVGQEILATSDPFLDKKLFFWVREKGTAEVDYLFPHKGTIYPIEVKAGKGGKLKSLHIFIQEKKSPFGVKISSDPLEASQGLLSIPLYLTAHLARLIDSI